MLLRDGSTGTLYRYGNGTLISLLPLAVQHTLLISSSWKKRNSHSSGYVNGDISYFQFYNKELTETQSNKITMQLRWYGVNGKFFRTNLLADKLIICLDAGNTNSYPGSGTTWTDVV